MESSSSIILIINFILQVLQMFDHSLLKRITSSKCICGEIQLQKPKDDEGRDSYTIPDPSNRKSNAFSLDPSNKL